MRIGVPRERKDGETRVALTPEQCRELTQLGSSVLIETNAGARSFYSDAEYSAAGATIISSLETLWEQADLLLKVKEPAPEEYVLFRKSQIVFSFLHPAAFSEMTHKLVSAGCTAYSYDLLHDSNGALPLLRPMSIIAGTLAIYAGSNALLTDKGGRGVLLSSVCGLDAGSVLILGGGSAGTAAAVSSCGLGANTTIFDVSPARVSQLKELLPKARVELSSEELLDSLLPQTDLLIGAVLVPGDKAPKVLTRKRLATMKAGSAFVDISIDQGGCAETSVSTSISKPTYIEQSVVHYCVPNMPALAAQTATRALTAETFPYVKQLATSSAPTALAEAGLASALVCHEGNLIHPVVAAALG